MTEPTSRKRSLDDVSETSRESSASPLPNIQRLSLEAIFHPKFENENSDLRDIRMKMHGKIEAKEGYLEVSLKHSGTLLLWSGGQRYYSKNSTSNPFTYVGEVLLRQHLYRSWYPTDINGEDVYQECSNFVEQNRLTLAFELVTSVLGHHGDLPRKDFLILTAVADKSTERFYSTVQVMEFAQRFRLPHNDVWVCSSQESAERLFYLYDTTRETGKADDTISALNDSADGHVSSMYPHVDFQGDILEGIVIRYVAFDKKTGNKKNQQEQLARLEAASTEILRSVPPDLAQGFQLAQKDATQPRLLSVDVRQVYNASIEKHSYADVISHVGTAALLALHESTAARRTTEKLPVKEWSLPTLTNALLENADIDNETRRIAQLITKLDSLNSPVRYTVMRENNARCLCTIHVLHDRTFFNYQKQMTGQDMHLFRGFSVELMDKQAPDSTMGDEQCEATIHDNDDAHLMLKMKFLPYMVRTFGCRNGLRVVRQSGPEGFVRHTQKLMTLWGISADAKLKWQRFFGAWGQYAHECIVGSDKDYIDKSLPPLSEAFYLNHLEQFIPRYEEGVIVPSLTEPGGGKSTFRGMVIVVAPTKATAESVATTLSHALDGVRCHKDINTLTQDEFVNLRLRVGGGLVVSAAIEEGFGRLRKFTKMYGDQICIVLVGCDAESIESTLLPNTRKLVGLAKGWSKTAVALIKHVALQSSTNSDNDEDEEDTTMVEESQLVELEKLVDDLKKFGDGVSVLDARSGMLLFFPCIPGSGKSALSGLATRERLTIMLQKLARDKSTKPRGLTVLVGDEVKKKYWAEVKQRRLEAPANLFIADKNAPVSAFSTVGDAAGNALVVPILPGGGAMSTTRIIGIRTSEGESNDSKTHIYPFSLSYLAVCMSRVLSRRAGSHVGGLDSSLPHACLVVIKFFGFYRNLSADVFLDALRNRIDGSGAVCARNAIEIPFFREADTIVDLPADLTQALTEALQFQYGYEIEEQDLANLFGKVPHVKHLELTLREVIEKHRATINALTVDEETSRSALLESVSFAMETLEDSTSLASASLGKGAGSSWIKLVSIDIPIESLTECIKRASEAQDELKSVFQSMGAGLEEEFKLAAGLGFVQQTHVTMAHHADFSQDEMRSRFDGLVGQPVDVKITEVLASDRIASLAVQLPATTSEGTALPPSKNDFVHVTLWKNGHINVKSVESNHLRELVSTGKASSVCLYEPVTVGGTLAFWS